MIDEQKIAGVRKQDDGTILVGEYHDTMLLDHTGIVEIATSFLTGEVGIVAGTLIIEEKEGIAGEDDDRPKMVEQMLSFGEKMLSAGFTHVWDHEPERLDAEPPLVEDWVEEKIKQIILEAS